MAFSKLRNLAVRSSSLITECGLLQSCRHSSTKYFRQVPKISLKDEVAGRREYCDVAQFAASSNESLAPSSSINVKGGKKNYTSYDLIESLYHLTEHSAPFKIPKIKAAYSHFCAGEILGDVFYELQRMGKMGLKGILNYSVEDAEDNDACDANLKHFLGIVSSISLFPPQSVTFVSLKLSAICTPELLERVSHLLRWQHRHTDFNLPWKEEVLPLLAPSSPDHYTTSAPEPLSPKDENDLNLAEQRLFQLCRACEAASLPLLVDAEYTAVQPAIDYLVYKAFSKFNQSPGKPVVYGTVQAYLKDSFPRLIAATEEAKKRGITMGVKLVRGAYIKVENRVAKSLSMPSSIHSSRMETRSCYDDCASFLLQKVATGEAALLLATHNLESVNTAIAKAEELDIVESKGMLQFAQLKGMSDLLSLGIQNAGFQVSKFLPFGTVENLIPYLMRRAEEQKIMLGEKIRGACKMYLSARVPTQGDHIHITRLAVSRLELTYIGSEDEEDDTSKSDEEDGEDDTFENEEDEDDYHDEDDTSESDEEDEDYYHDEDGDDTPKDDHHHGNHISLDHGTPKDDNTSQNDKYSTYQSTVSVQKFDDYLNKHKKDVDAILKDFDNTSQNDKYHTFDYTFPDDEDDTR